MVYTRCDQCGKKFEQKLHGKRAKACPRCHEEPGFDTEYHNNRNMKIREFLKIMLRNGCYFAYLNNCLETADFKAVRKDGKTILDTHGQNSLLSCKINEIITVIEHPDEYVSLCDRHCGMVTMYFVNNPQATWDEVMLYVIDQETTKVEK